MRILFLTQVLPYPLDAGPKTRAYYVLRHLAAAGHEVTLLSFTRASDRAEHIRHLRAFCREVQTVPMERSRFKDGRRLARSLAGDTPFLIARDREPAMLDAVRNLCATRPFDAIHADQLWMGPYAQGARSKGQGAGGEGRGIMTVLDQHNAVFQIPKRLAEWESNPVKRRLLYLETRKMAAYEARICQEFDHVVWVTAEDRQAVADAQNIRQDRTRIQQIGRKGPDFFDLVHWNPQSQSNPKAIPLPPGNRPKKEATRLDDPIIPICVDPEAQQPIEPMRNPHRVTFLGGLHWPPNAAGMAWFVEEVWPRIAARHPDATLTVIGKDPPPPLQAAQSQGRNIHITGYVEDPRPYLAETGAFIVPLHAGGGMRVKILDAWQWGLPVVSTGIGAEGIQVRDGENLLLADDAEAFAVAVTRLLADSGLAARLRQGGRATVEAEYDWRTVYRAWDQVYAQT